MGLPRQGAEPAGRARPLSGSLFAAPFRGNLPAGGIHPSPQQAQQIKNQLYCPGMQAKVNSIPIMCFQGPEQLTLAPLYAVIVYLATALAHLHLKFS